MGVAALFFYGQNALAQSDAQSDDRTDEGEFLTYEPTEYSEVFGLSRSGNSSDFSVVFRSRPSEEIPELPKTRLEWMDIAKRIKSGDMDYEIYYAMLRGEKPDDIFTTDLMAIYQPLYEDWLLARWDTPSNDASTGELIYLVKPEENKCNSDLRPDLTMTQKSSDPPTAEQVQRMFRTMLDAIECDKSHSEGRWDIQD